MIPETECRLNLLVAYPYANAATVKALADRRDEIRFVLDSGAFTAFKSGKPIALDDYCRFIEGLPFRPWRYFVLDVIGDPEASERNYETMRARGFNPVPIFTRGESLDALDRYYETSDVVGIGGLVGTQGNKGFVNGVMKRVAGRKVHWLGFMSGDYLRAYRPYMCDSSSWASGTVFGATKLYWNGRVIVVTKKDFASRPRPELLEILGEFGVDPRRLARADQWVNSGCGRNANEVLAFRSYSRFQLDVRRHLGSHVFMALNAAEQVRLAHESFQFWRAKRPELFV